MAEDVGAPRRGMAARIGIVLLNLAQPGLGLIRLAQYRAGFAFMALTLAMAAFISAVWAAKAPLTYAMFIGVIVAAVAAIGPGYVGSMVLTWRRSGRIAARSGWLWRWWGVAAIWLVLALMQFALDEDNARYHSFYAQSVSMAPTLEAGDRFVVRTSDFTPLHRGDVVVYRVGGVDYIKRVAGLPGDTIAMRGGVLSINGQMVPQRPVGAMMRTDDGQRQQARVLSEQFPGEARPHEVLDLGVTPQDDFAPTVVAAGQYFVLGDNRDNSVDSRMPRSDDMPGGLVSIDEIRGRALFRFWRRGDGLGKGQL